MECYKKKRKIKKTNGVKKGERSRKGVVGWNHQKGGVKSSNSSVFGRGCASEKQVSENQVESSFERKYKPDNGSGGQVFDETNQVFEDNKVGRPNCMDVEKREKLLEVYYSRPYSLRKLAVMFGVSRMTVWRVVQEFGQAPNFVL